MIPYKPKFNTVPGDHPIPGESMWYQRLYKFYFICLTIPFVFAVRIIVSNSNEILLFPGGVFPMPPGLAQLTAELPPPSCFHGPFVSIDLLLEHLDRLALANSGM